MRTILEKLPIFSDILDMDIFGAREMMTASCLRTGLISSSTGMMAGGWIAMNTTSHEAGSWLLDETVISGNLFLRESKISGRFILNAIIYI